jgi:hypothetical protein
MNYLGPMWAVLLFKSKFVHEKLNLQGKLKNSSAKLGFLMISFSLTTDIDRKV